MLWKRKLCLISFFFSLIKPVTLRFSIAHRESLSNELVWREYVHRTVRLPKAHFEINVLEKSKQGLKFHPISPLFHPACSVNLVQKRITAKPAC